MSFCGRQEETRARAKSWSMRAVERTSTTTRHNQECLWYQQVQPHKNRGALGDLASLVYAPPAMK